MMRKALGILEVFGFVAAVEVADICVKTSAVTLVGCEKVKGNGLCVIKLEGDIGAVKAAVDAGTARAAHMGKLSATTVIARPADGMYEAMIQPRLEALPATGPAKQDEEEKAIEAVATESQPKELPVEETNPPPEPVPAVTDKAAAEQPRPEPATAANAPAEEVPPAVAEEPQAPAAAKSKKTKKKKS